MVGEERLYGTMVSVDSYLESMFSETKEENTDSYVKSAKSGVEAKRKRIICKDNSLIDLK